jgi:hypothetical protein
MICRNNREQGNICIYQRERKAGTKEIFKVQKKYCKCENRQKQKAICQHISIVPRLLKLPILGLILKEITSHLFPSSGTQKTLNV